MNKNNKNDTEKEKSKRQNTTSKKKNNTKTINKKNQEINNLNIEIKNNLTFLFREFQNIIAPDISELKIFELKVSILKEILKMNLEIDKKVKENNEITKENSLNKKEEYIKTDLIDNINDLINHSLYSDIKKD